MVQRSATAQFQVQDASHFLKRVRRLHTIIADASDRAEQNHELPLELLKVLHQNSLFQLLLPKPFGGFEIDPAGFCQIIEGVAKIDASTAWCLCQANGCAMAAAFVPDQVAKDIWLGNKPGVLAWGPGKGDAVRYGDCYRLSGSWSFVSGGRHATWLGGHAILREENGDPYRDTHGQTLSQTFLFPSSQAMMTKTWDVIGLLGTGSDTFSVEDISVPITHVLSRDDASARRYQAPLYLFPATSLYASGFAGTALGIARSMLDSFKSLVLEKTPRLERQQLHENAIIQTEIGQSEARLNAARTFLVSELEDIWSTVTTNQSLTIEQRMRIRLASTHAIHESKTVANAAYETAGASAIFVGSPFQRRFRDIHTVAQQIQGRKSHFQTVGSFLLGHPPDLAMV